MEGNIEIEGKMDAAGEYRMEEHVCRICGKRSWNKTYQVKEMMYGTREEFDYFVCSSCNCMQIVKAPEDLGNYYSDNYYSLKEREIPEFHGEADVENKVLDVGCGSGKWLLKWAEKGCGNLYGCDPFIKEDICYGDRVYIKKCDISGMEGKFDFIRFGDSFEHIDNPLETLEYVKRILNKDGKCEIQIPIFPNAAWDVFGVNWYQLDAPRHLFLHSEESMRYMCKRCGLRVEEVIYDSDVFQFIYSYLYTEGLHLSKIQEMETMLFDWKPEMLAAFSKMTDESNKKKYGDHAIFEIVHA